MTTGVLSVAADLFYDQFGIAASDAGVGVEDLVVQSFAGLLYWLTLPLMTFVPLVFVVRRMLGDLPRGWPGWLTVREAPRWALIVMAPLLLVAAVASLAAGVAWAATLYATWVSISAWGIALAIALIVAGPLLRKLSFATRADRSAAIVASALTALGTASFIIATAYIDDRSARDGDAIELRPFFPWQATLAEVSWTRPGAGIVTTECGLYLGQSGGSTFLNVPGQKARPRRSVSYPTSQTRVRLYPDADADNPNAPCVFN